MSRSIRRNADFARGLVLAEEARMNLPIPVYLNLLHQALTTGKMPVLDAQGKPVMEDGFPKYDELNVAQRTDLAKFLINKVLPDVPKEVTMRIQEQQPTENTPLDRIPHLPIDALRAMAAGEITDAVFAPKESDVE